MYLFNNVNFLDIKMISNDDKTCNGNCIGCSDMIEIIGGFNNFNEVIELFNHLENDKIIDLYKLREIVIFGTTIFNFPLDEILYFFKKYEKLNLKIHVDLSNLNFINNLKKIYNFKYIFRNVRFFLYKSYHKKSDLNILELQEIINFFKINGLKFQFDIIANSETFDLKKLKNIFNNYIEECNPLGNSVDIEDNILVKGKKVINRNKCTLIDSYKIVGDTIYIDTIEDLYLDIALDGDIRVHNLPCQWGKITISNIYRNKKEILNDFIKFKFFLISNLSIGNEDFGYKCYNCYYNIRYHYKKYIK